MRRRKKSNRPQGPKIRITIGRAGALKSIDKAIASLAAERRRLEDGQGRIARRNARRSVARMLSIIRTRLDDDYPAIGKAKAPAPAPSAKPAKVKPLRLPFYRAFDNKSAKLFAEIMANVRRVQVPRFQVHEHADPNGSKRYGRIIYAPSWSAAKKWMEIVRWFGLTPETIDLWRRFWSELIEIDDLALAAEHQKFIERAAARSATARKAIATMRASKAARS